MNSPMTRTRCAVLTLLFVAILVLAGCGGGDSSPAESDGAAAENTPLRLRVGVTPVPAGDILRFVKENLAPEAGLELEIVEFTDYVAPNIALRDGELDANFFQHVPYMEDFGKQHGIDLVAVAPVHINPIGAYSKTIKSIDELPDGAEIAIPNDATNGGRALLLLQAEGLITLREGTGITPTVRDIVDNPKNLIIRELEAAQIPRALDDVELAVINGNYAMTAGFKPKEDAIIRESPIDNPYANVLAVLRGHEHDPAVKILAELLNRPEVRDFIDEKYDGSVIAAF